MPESQAPGAVYTHAMMVSRDRRTRPSRGGKPLTPLELSQEASSNLSLILLLYGANMNSLLFYLREDYLHSRV